MGGPVQGGTPNPLAPNFSLSFILPFLCQFAAMDNLQRRVAKCVSFGGTSSRFARRLIRLVGMSSEAEADTNWGEKVRMSLRSQEKSQV